MSWSTASGTLTLNGTNAPVNAPSFHIVGTSLTTWGSIPLPFELPGTASAPSGSCFVHTDIALTLGANASATGALTSSVPVPAQPYLNGATVYSQWASLDPAANSFGVVSSPVVGHNWVAPTPVPPLVRVFLSGSLAANGNLGPNTGLVTRFN